MERDSYETPDWIVLNCEVDIRIERLRSVSMTYHDSWVVKLCCVYESISRCWWRQCFEGCLWMVTLLRDVSQFGADLRLVWSWSSLDQHVCFWDFDHRQSQCVDKWGCREELVKSWVVDSACTSRDTVGLKIDQRSRNRIPCLYMYCSRQVIVDQTDHYREPVIGWDRKRLREDKSAEIHRHQIEANLKDNTKTYPFNACVFLDSVCMVSVASHPRQQFIQCSWLWKQSGLHIIQPAVP